MKFHVCRVGRISSFFIIYFGQNYADNPTPKILHAHWASSVTCPKSCSLIGSFIRHFRQWRLDLVSPRNDSNIRSILRNQQYSPTRNLLFYAACIFFAASSMSLAVAEFTNFTGSRSPRMTVFLFFINSTAMQTSESWIICFLEPDFFLTLNERLSVSIRSLNV